MAELADAPDLGSGSQECRFDPCYPYQKTTSFDRNLSFSTLFACGEIKSKEFAKQIVLLCSPHADLFHYDNEE